MIARIQKWGNSLALRIPKTVAEQLDWGQDAQVSLAVVEGKLVVETERASRYELEELLAGITVENTHQETETGTPVGSETW